MKLFATWGGGINYIISNPPFSLKTQILTRLYEFGIPFAMLMQLNSAIETEPRQILYKQYGVQLLVPNSRVWYYSQTWEKPKSSAVFMSGFVCWNVLNNPLVFDTWDKTHLL